MDESKNIKGEPLSGAILSCIKEGRKLEAIKLLREETGNRIKGSKRYRRKIRGKEQISADPMKMNMPQEALNKLSEGNKIEAIKIIREHNGSGLKESKEFAEKWIENNPGLQQLYEDKLETDAKQTFYFRSDRNFCNTACWVSYLIILVDNTDYKPSLALSFSLLRFAHVSYNHVGGRPNKRYE